MPHPLSIEEETRKEKLIKRSKTLKGAPKVKKSMKNLEEKKEEAKKKIKKEKKMKKMVKVVKKRQEKFIKKAKKKIPKKSRSRSKIVPKEISRTKSIIKQQPLAFGNVEILQAELKSLQSKERRILARDKFLKGRGEFIPSSSDNSLRVIRKKIKNNIEEQNELIDEFGL